MGEREKLTNWIGVPRKRFSGWFLVWNVLLRILFPVEALVVPNAVVYHHHRDPNSYRHHQRPPQFQHTVANSYKPLVVSASMSQSVPLSKHQSKNSFTVDTNYYLPRLDQTTRRPGWRGADKKQDLEKCDGRGNLLQDLGVIAIFSGAVSLVMSIYTASYFSVLGNAISIISGAISYLTGIPSAVLTYLAASDRISYTVANVLSLLSLANTAYGFWSVDFGNKDIFTSHVSNIIGVFSLVLSIVTAFPELFDVLVYEFGKNNPVKKREIKRFLRNYGCSGGTPTIYEISQDVLRQLSSFM